MFRFLNRTFSGQILRVELGFIARLLTSLFWAVGSLRLPRRRTKTSRSAADESRRLAGCKEVVLQYAEALGFIARESIARDGIRSG